VLSSTVRTLPRAARRRGRRRRDRRGRRRREGRRFAAPQLGGCLRPGAGVSGARRQSVVMACGATRLNVLVCVHGQQSEGCVCCVCFCARVCVWVGTQAHTLQFPAPLLRAWRRFTRARQHVHARAAPARQSGRTAGARARDCVRVHGAHADCTGGKGRGDGAHEAEAGEAQALPARQPWRACVQQDAQGDHKHEERLRPKPPPGLNHHLLVGPHKRVACWLLPPGGRVALHETPCSLRTATSQGGLAAHCPPPEGSAPPLHVQAHTRSRTIPAVAYQSVCGTC